MPDEQPLDLEIHERAVLSIVEAPDGNGVLNPDGTVTMALIRPCNGRGPYKNIYEADMLRRNAANFKGLPMFDNHDSPVAKKARLGFPRSPSELAGAVRESWWDPSFTTPEDEKYGFDQGGVMGKCALTDAMEALVVKIPEVVKGSLNTQATGKRLGERNGQKGWIVEGFANDPETCSFDLVTAAGAGGRVASVLEGVYADANGTDGHANGGSGMGDELTLVEALQSDEVKGYIATMVGQGVQEALAAGAKPVDEAALKQEIRDELAVSHRLRVLRDTARGVIEASPLKGAAQSRLLEDYGLTDNDDDSVTPGRSLALVEAVVDDAGAVTKTAKAVLEENVKADIAAYRTMISEAAPTVPRAPLTGGGSSAGGGENDVQESAWEQKLRQRGLDPEQFGAPKRETTTAAK